MGVPDWQLGLCLSTWGACLTGSGIGDWAYIVYGEEMAIAAAAVRL
jgi:hypothetical protein